MHGICGTRISKRAGLRWLAPENLSEPPYNILKGLRSCRNISLKGVTLRMDSRVLPARAVRGAAPTSQGRLIKKPTLTVEVSGADIVVTLPGTGCRVAYTKSEDNKLIASSFSASRVPEEKRKI